MLNEGVLGTSPPPSITDWERDDMTFVYVPPVSDDTSSSGAREFTSSSGRRNLAELHTRGNSSRKARKKQFALKLPTPETLIPGGAKAKKWVLSAYTMDKSYIDNKLVYDMYIKFGELQREFSDTWPKEGSVEDLSARAYAPRTQMVNLIFQGRYAGIYYLMDKIEQGKGRVWLPKAKASKSLAPDPTEVDGVKLPQDSYLLRRDWAKVAVPERLYVPNFRPSSDAVFDPESTVCVMNLLDPIVRSNGLIGDFFY